MNKVIELRTLVHAQPHNIFLEGDFPDGHESPPSLACNGSDSEILIRFNDVRH